ncbi:MAG: aryl-sulfate sulfotransferase [Alphaproteobacteria bacterium]|nr:aryl-sulfate sulfotransferase [Alphaproteobacteria bacterium]
MIERWMFKTVEVWAVGLLCVAGFLAIILVSALAREHAEGNRRFGPAGEAAHFLSMVPETIASLGAQAIGGQKVVLAVTEERFEGESGLAVHGDPDALRAEGYLLLSRYDGDRHRSLVELVDLAGGRIVHRWEPDFAAQNERSEVVSSLTVVPRDNAPNRARMFHPLLTPDGGLVFQNMTPLTRVDSCGRLDWLTQKLFHHSIEPHPEGGYLASAFLEPQTIEGVGRRFKEDAIVHVSDGGEILFERSVPALLIANGHAHLVFGQDFYSDDPLHLNDVQYAPFDGPHWKKGDLFLSLRNVSAIVQYRPSTDEVVWMKQGPWVNQHDVDILDAHRIAIFNNNRFNGRHGAYVDGVNTVMVYDFATDSVSEPYRGAMERLDIRTISEGRSEILSDGGVFIEESNYGRAVRLAADGSLLWSFVNRAGDGRVYLLSWSRYIPKETGRAVLRALSEGGCAIPPEPAGSASRSPEAVQSRDLSVYKGLAAAGAAP